MRDGALRPVTSSRGSVFPQCHLTSLQSCTRTVGACAMPNVPFIVSPSMGAVIPWQLPCSGTHDRDCLLYSAYNVISWTAVRADQRCVSVLCCPKCPQQALSTHAVTEHSHRVPLLLCALCLHILAVQLIVQCALGTFSCYRRDYDRSVGRACYTLS
jgi:hypothetical protein